MLKSKRGTIHVAVRYRRNGKKYLRPRARCNLKIKVGYSVPPRKKCRRCFGKPLA